MKTREEYIMVKKLGPIMNIYVMPDCHFGSPAFIQAEYERLANIIERDPIAKLIFQGDILDSNRPSTRQVKKIAYHDRPEEYEQEDERNNTWIDTEVLPKLKRIIKNKSRCIGMMDGDHYLLMSNGLTSTQYLCSMLRVPYLGDGQAIVRFHFTYSPSGKYDGGRTDVVMHCQHGIGGGGRNGNNVNKLEDTANIWDGVDIHVRGHSHKGFIFPISKYYVRHKTGDIHQRDIWLVNTPSFRTGFIMGKTDYAEKRNYAATAHKFPVIRLSGSKTAANKHSFTINITGELV